MGALAQGTRVGDYVLRQHLGAGGFGEVWTADDDGEVVALKFLHPHLQSAPDAAERFRREVVTTARLAHPAVVAAFDAGQTAEGHLWFAMECVDGRPIDAVWDGDVGRTLSWFDDLFAVLGYAHARGVMHRDLKPDNVLVTATGDLRLLDFGIAGVDVGLAGVGPDTSITRPGMPLGTVAYMSPEQSRGAAAICGPASDLYSVGIMLYQFLVGQVPYTGSWIEVMAGHTLTPLPDIQVRDGLRDVVPAAVLTLVGHLLAKPYPSRPESAAAARDELRRARVHMGAAWGAASVPRGDRDATIVAARTPRGSGAPQITGKGVEAATGIDIARARELPILGREAEVQNLHACLGVPGITWVTGAAGAGSRHVVRHVLYDTLERGAGRVLAVHIGAAGLWPAMHGALTRALRVLRLERRWLSAALWDDWGLDNDALCDFMAAGPAHGPTLQTANAGTLVAGWIAAVRALAGRPAPAPLTVWLDGDDASELLDALVEQLATEHRVIRTHAAQVPGASDVALPHPSVVTLPPLPRGSIAEVVACLAPDADAGTVEHVVAAAVGLPGRAREITLEWLRSGRQDASALAIATARLAEFGADDKLAALGLLGGPFPAQLVSMAFDGDAAALLRAIRVGLLEADPDQNGKLRFSPPETAALLARTHPAPAFAVEIVSQTALAAVVAGNWATGEDAIALAWRLDPSESVGLLDLACLLAHRRRDAAVLAARAARVADPHTARYWTAQSRALSDPAAAARDLESLLTEPLGLVVRGRVLLALGQCAGHAGRPGDASRCAQEAIATLAQLPLTTAHRMFRADAISLFVDTLIEGGNTGAARTQLGLLMQEYAALGDVQGQAQAQLRQARIARRDAQDPTPALRAARTLLLEVDDRRSLAVAEWEEGSFRLGRKDLETADERFVAAELLFASIGDRGGAATCTNARGEVARALGHLALAATHYERFLTVMDDLGHGPGRAWARANLGWTSLQTGAVDAAIDRFDAALALTTEGTDVAISATAGLGLCALRSGDAKRAKAIVAHLGDAADTDGAAALAEIQRAPV